MGSRGSVIPFFLKRRHSGVLPVTDERMTRFNLTLQEGVDFVLTCLDRMWGGELFVPRIPSYRILDVANAVAPEARVEITGIRPGEKLHEEMITATDALATVEFDNYFVILPSAPLWDAVAFAAESYGRPGHRCDYGFSYNSGTNSWFLSVSELRDLIASQLQDVAGYV
jgi:UDP-N-acetylglucosamine 4,6-dehydratase/5-epimerase